MTVDRLVVIALLCSACGSPDPHLVDAGADARVDRMDAATPVDAGARTADAALADARPLLDAPADAPLDAGTDAAPSSDAAVSSDAEPVFDASAPFDACIAISETCNHADDDCNGVVDDGFEMEGAPCLVGVGACEASGVLECSSDGLTLSCSASPGASTTELCGNGVDDDCDATTDEGFPTLGDACDGPDRDLCAEGAITCGPARLDVVCSDETAANPELCNGTDDDCDPMTADGLDDPSIGALCDSPADTDACIEGTWSCGGGLVCSDPGTDETSSDVDHCGMCGLSCANPHGGRSCTSGICTPSCAFGWFACGAPELGCASQRNTGTPCTGSTDLGSIDGDGPGGGDAGTGIYRRTGFADARFHFLVRDMVGCLTDAVGVRVTFTNPPGVRFSVCSRCAECGSGGAERCVTPVAGGASSFYLQSFDNCTADDTHRQFVRVFYVSGDGRSCGDWSLEIQGNQTTDHDRTCGADL